MIEKVNGVDEEPESHGKLNMLTISVDARFG